MTASDNRQPPLKRIQNRLTRPFACVALVALTGCQCDTIQALNPRIVVAPEMLTFEPVPTGTVAQLALSVTNASRAPLVLKTPTMSEVNDITIASVLVKDCNGGARTVPNPLVIDAEQCAEIVIQFTGSKVEAITNTVLISSNDPKNALVKVPVTAAAFFNAAPQIEVCVLDASGNLVSSQCTNWTSMPPFTPTLAFGTVTDGQSAKRKVRVLSSGNTPLTLTTVRMVSTSADLSIGTPLNMAQTLAPMATMDFDVSFTPQGTGAITGDVRILSNAVGHTQVDVPVTANEQSAACVDPTAHLRASVGASALTANTVLQMTTVIFTASGTGGSGYTFTWSLVSAPSGNTSMLSSSGPTATLDCTETGTYEVGVTVEDSAGCTSSQATMSITVDALPQTCGPETQFVYLVDESGVLYKFYPGMSGLTSLGSVGCAALSTVNTMAVDRQGLAWVEYEDASLFKVNTTTLACYPTGLSTNATSDGAWGSAFVLDAVGSTTATYYITDNRQLLSINTSTLAVTTIGSLTGSANGAQEAELTGTPSGELYGLFPPGNNWVLAPIDTTTGAEGTQIQLPVIGRNIASAGNWAFASWNNDFWFFVGDGISTDVFHYAGATGTTSLAFTTQAIIVGAGVSPCVGAQ